MDRAKAIIATLILRCDLFGRFAEMLHPDMMESAFEPDLKPILEKMFEIRANNSQWDAFTFSEFKSTDDLIRNFPVSSDQLGDHIRELHKGFLNTRLSNMFSNAVSAINTEGKGYHEVLSQFEKEKNDLNALTVQEENRDAVLLRTFERMNTHLENPEQATGIPTPWKELTDFIGGWQGGDLIVFGGIPGMGKTTLMCEIALEASRTVPVAYFSLGDMTKERLYIKIVLMLAGINYSRYRKGDLTPPQKQLIGQKQEILAGLPLEIFDYSDTPGDIINLQEKVFKYHSRGKRLFVFDYVQQISGIPGKKYQRHDLEVGDITRILKQLAVKLDIPVIFGSQLNRNSLSRPDRRPTLADFRNSGNIEQDVDFAFFTNRPEKHLSAEQSKTDANGKDLSNLLELMLKKDRDGGQDKDFELKMHQGRLITLNQYEEIQFGGLVPAGNGKADIPF